MLVSTDESEPDSDQGAGPKDLDDGLLGDVRDLEEMAVDDEEIEKPTLSNYKTYFNRISIERIRARLALRGRTNTRPRNAALAALQIAEDEFRKSIALIAWAENLSEATAEKHA